MDFTTIVEREIIIPEDSQIAMTQNLFIEVIRISTYIQTTTFDEEQGRK